ncbi:MAG: hypothetical protein MN733_04595, partial [Nitrososphaera sp.]|nr:hypothetical protein [Nitrososphaera sp.]
FSNKLGYYYAQSKEIGEAAVRNSGLDFTIVRPTIVIAKGSPLFERLSMLARLPVIPMFGDGTKTIQPIYIGDLVECLLYILRDDVFCNETYELGGPEAITLENFVKAIRHVSLGKRSIVVHVPLKAVMGVISIFDKYFHSLLPVSAGQLSVFDNDGSIRPNRVFSALVSEMRTVDEMLQLVIEDAK